MVLLQKDDIRSWKKMEIESGERSAVLRRQLHDAIVSKKKCLALTLLLAPILHKWSKTDYKICRYQCGRAL